MLAAGGVRRYIGCFVRTADAGEPASTSGIGRDPVRQQSGDTVGDESRAPPEERRTPA